LRIGINCYPTFGGSGVVATELAMALADRGDDVHVISYALPSRLEFRSKNLQYHEVVVSHYPLFEYPPYSLSLATAMVETARHYELDLIHVHYAVPNAVSAVLARQILAPQPLKVVTTLHGTDITLVGNDPSYLETTRFGIQQSDAVTAVSDFLRADTYRQLGVDKEIEVVPNFIEPERFERAKRNGESRWRNSDESLIVHISNFRPVKRVLDVVRAFRRIRESIPARLLLVGDGPDRARIDNYCRERGLCDAIDFLGNMPIVEGVLAAADLFLLPSETESFGLAALEALSCGVPVIATDVGGLPEVVQHAKNGFLFSVGDVDAMSRAAIQLLSDPVLHEEFSTRARAWAVERFTEDRVVEQYRALYERTLAG